MYISKFFIIPVALFLITNSYFPSMEIGNAFVDKLRNADFQSKSAVAIKEENSSINDPDYEFQWAVTSTESNKAWSLVNQKKTVKVAIVDTGVDYNHPDLKNRVLTEMGYNFVGNNKDVIDDNWHGTHIAGIIAAEMNNNQGITGIVGPLDVKIIPVKVLDKNGQGDSPIIAEGIKYAANKGADIINISIGFKAKDSYIEDAVNYANRKGVLVIAAAGNDNSNSDLYSPAGDKGVFTVAAVDSSYNKASFSNYGSAIMLAAPGVDIISTAPGNSYEYRNGTSMAAPAVAGVAAMMKAENPKLTPEEIQKILIASSNDIMTSGKDDYSGYGFVNAYKALQMVQASERGSTLNNMVNINYINMF
jgi:subtilisin family serine protease